MATTTSMVCLHCGGTFNIRGTSYSCPSCKEPLILPFCTTYFPKENKQQVCSLGEGNTPLLAVNNTIPSITGSLFLKVETGNPTGSFKDRGSALVAEEARRMGYAQCAIASTGNAGASMAAYCSRMGLDLTVVVPANTPKGKLKQLHYYGAKIKEVNGNFLLAEKVYEELVKAGYYPAGPENPFRIEGIKSMAYEIVEQCDGKVPDRVMVPIGTGGLMTSLFKGFKEMVSNGTIAHLPKLDAVQLEHVTPLLGSTDYYKPNYQKSVASGINIAQPILATEVKLTLRESGGMLLKVNDQEILLAQRELAIYSGIGTEATGAVTTAAYKKALKVGDIGVAEKVVVPITGHMLKE